MLKLLPVETRQWNFGFPMEAQLPEFLIKWNHRLTFLLPEVGEQFLTFYSVTFNGRDFLTVGFRWHSSGEKLAGESK